MLRPRQIANISATSFCRLPALDFVAEKDAAHFLAIHNSRNVFLSPRIRVAKMDFTEALASSEALAKKIEKRGFAPVAVIGIATGGLVPAHVVSTHLGCPLIIIKMARPLTGFKSRLGLSRIPKSVKNFLRRLEMSLGLYRILRKRKIAMISGELKPGRYVIVDDSLDTGNTMRVALEYLWDTAAIPRSDVILASLTQIFDNASPAADVCMYRSVNFEFPWSQDSPEHSLFLSYCARELSDS